MTFAQVTNSTITTVAGRIPNAAQRLDTRAWVLPESGVWSTAEAAACGWFPVVDVARPADTATTTHDRSVELVATVPTVVWTPRLWATAELASRAEQANGDTIRTQATTALTNNRTFIAVTAPTNAQVVAQVRALTLQSNALIRLALNALDGTD